MQNRTHCDSQRPKSCECLDDMALAMAYVPWQTFHDTFKLDKALQAGTIFPELCKPFCGRRGGAR